MNLKIRNFPYKSVLIVCSVNTARSCMTEGYLKHLFTINGLDVKIYSGGISSNARDGMLISLDAKLAMQEEGIILSEESVSIDLKKHSELINNADLILTLTEKHKEEIIKFVNPKNGSHIHTLKQFAGDNGDIEDPSMKGIDGFRKARDQIKKCILKGLKNYK